MIIKGSNEPLVMLVTPDCVTAKFGSVTVQDGGGILHQWLRYPAETDSSGNILKLGRDDIYTVKADYSHTVCECEWDQEDTVKLPVGPVKIVAKFRDANGNVLHSRTIYDIVSDCGDETILGG